MIDFEKVKARIADEIADCIHRGWYTVESEKNYEVIGNHFRDEFNDLEVFFDKILDEVKNEL